MLSVGKTGLEPVNYRLLRHRVCQFRHSPILAGVTPLRLGWAVLPPLPLVDRLRREQAVHTLERLARPPPPIRAGFPVVRRVLGRRASIRFDVTGFTTLHGYLSRTKPAPYSCCYLTTKYPLPVDRLASIPEPNRWSK